jgi:hypothetical protein
VLEQSAQSQDASQGASRLTCRLPWGGSSFDSGEAGLLTFNQKVVVFKAVVACWTVAMVVGLSILTYVEKPPLPLGPEFVLVVIFGSIGLLSLVGILLCRCPRCRAMLWGSARSGFEVDFDALECPYCRSPLSE